MTDWNVVSAFLSAVVPWPVSPEDIGYVNLHYSALNTRPGGKKFYVGGWPFRTVDKFVQRAAWIEGTQFKDVWFCTSLQREMATNTKGKPKAKRNAANALALKAIWIDLDVGEGLQKYATAQDAVKAVITFAETVGLPMPSAMVGSGSGIHAYWISDVSLPTATWTMYAEGLRAKITETGLRCDAGLTTDSARLLRVPGTFNHKSDPPKPVALLNVPLKLYNFDTQLSFLKGAAPPRAEKEPEYSPYAENVKPFGKPAAAFAGLTPDAVLQAGIDKQGVRLLDGKPIFKQCEFLREAFRTGGRDYGNPLWNLSLLCATFMENGNAVAHAVSKGHPAYDPDDTQAQYDRKVAERAERGLGYPSCATIAANGCGACASCPLFSKGKSPLNIRPEVTATVSGLNMAPPNPQSQGAKDLFLPFGYDLDDEGYICEVMQQDLGSDDSGPPMMYRLFLSKITDPWVQRDPDCINFTTTVDKGRVFGASIRHEDMSPPDLYRKLSINKVKIFPKNKQRLEHFFVSWLSKLHSVAAAEQSLPFGWYKDDLGVRRGFVYGGKVMLDDGTERPCGIGEATIRKIFHPNGDIQDWFRACTCITQQKRPELDAIIALSFASPLMSLAGTNSVTLCSYGESGVGKTSAYSVGIGVWGHSKKGKAVSNSTFNGVMRKMGELSNLPLYWDEIKDPKAQEAVYHYLYNASDGVEKDRMVDGTRMQDRGTWQNAMMMAANISFVDYVMKKDPSHIGGISRILEYHVAKVPPGSTGRISTTEAAIIIDKLQDSYGNMGMLYGKLLGLNHVAIAQEVVDTCLQIERDMVSQEAERLWVALVGCLLVGARLANTLGCDLDLPALKSFLYRVYKENRHKRDTMMNVGAAAGNMEALMSDYFAQVQTNDQAIWTDGITLENQPGPPGMVKVWKAPRNERNVAVTTGIACRWDTKTRALYVYRKHLTEYLLENNLGVSSTMAGLEKVYGMKYARRLSLGGGTGFNAGRAAVAVFPDIGPNHDWWELLWQHTPMDQRPGPDDPGSSPPPVDTGLQATAATSTENDNVIAFVKSAVR